MTLRILLPLFVVAGLGAWLLMSGDDPDADLATHDARKAEAADDAMRADAALQGRTAPTARGESDSDDRASTDPADTAEAEGSKPDAKHKYTIRDVYDGSVVPRVAMVIYVDADDSRTVRDGLFVKNEDDDTTWLVVSELMPPRVDVIWVARVIEAQVHITTASGAGLTPDQIRLDASLIDTNRAEAAHKPEEAPERARSGFHVLRPVWRVEQPPEALPGVFTVRVPRLPEVLVKATAPGFRQAFDYVPIEPDPTRTPLIHLHLERGPVIRGSIVDDTGAPVPDAKAELLVRRPAPRDRAALEKWMYGASPKCWVFGTKTEPYFVFTQELKLDAKGQFSANIPLAGEIGIKVKSGAHQRLERMFGELRDDTDVGAIQLTRLLQAKRLRLVGALAGSDDAFPLHNVRITIKRDRRESFFPKETLEVGKDGRVPAHELEAGKRYSVHVPGLEKWLDVHTDAGRVKWLPVGTLEWDGEQDVAVLTLHPDPR